jgi:hypothetical protein
VCDLIYSSIVPPFKVGVSIFSVASTSEVFIPLLSLSGVTFGSDVINDGRCTHTDLSFLTD